MSIPEDSAPCNRKLARRVASQQDVANYAVVWQPASCKILGNGGRDGDQGPEMGKALK